MDRVVDDRSATRVGPGSAPGGGAGAARPELPPHRRLPHRAPRAGQPRRGAEPAERGRGARRAAGAGRRCRRGRTRCSSAARWTGKTALCLAALRTGHGPGGARRAGRGERPGGAGRPRRRPRGRSPRGCAACASSPATPGGTPVSSRARSGAATGSWCPPCPTTCWPARARTCGAACCAARACRWRCWRRSRSTRGTTERSAASSGIQARDGSARGPERIRSRVSVAAGRQPATRSQPAHVPAQPDAGASTRAAARSPSAPPMPGEPQHPRRRHQRAPSRPPRPAAPRRPA